MITKFKGEQARLWWCFWAEPATSEGKVVLRYSSMSFLAVKLISFRIDWFDLLAVQGTLKSLLQHHSSKASIVMCSAFFIVQLSHPYMTTGKTRALTRQTFVSKDQTGFLTFTINFNSSHFYYSQFTTEYEECWWDLRVNSEIQGNRIYYINNRRWILRKCGLSTWVSSRIYPVKYAASGRSRKKHLSEKYGCRLSRYKSQRAYDSLQIFPKFPLNGVSQWFNAWLHCLAGTYLHVLDNIGKLLIHFSEPQWGLQNQYLKAVGGWTETHMYSTWQSS